MAEGLSEKRALQKKFSLCGKGTGTWGASDHPSAGVWPPAPPPALPPYLVPGPAPTWSPAPPPPLSG